MSKNFATNKLKTLKHKSTTIALVLMLTLTATFVTLGVVTAQDLDIPSEIQPWAFLTAAPDPVGIGQTIFMNMWLHMPAPTVNYLAGIDVWKGFTITVTKPDDTTVVLGPFQGDATGGTYTTYVADQLGEWNFKLDYPGQALTTSGPWEGIYFKPASATASLTVQQEQVVPYPFYPTPEDYWQRPIYSINTEWAKIGGNWFGLAATNFARTGMYNSSGNFNPYSTAPDTPHIVWTRPTKWGGQIGGLEPYGPGSEVSNFYATSQYEPQFAPIIMYGRIYWEVFPGSSTYPVGWNCVDIRTGELIWYKNTTDRLRCGWILDFESINQFGGIPYILADTTTTGNNTGATYRLYDAETCEYILDFVNASNPSGVGTPGLRFTLDTRTCKGSLLAYFTDSSAGTLNLWNATRAINVGSGGFFGGPGDPNNQFYRPRRGGQINFNDGIQWSVPYPQTLNNKSLSLSINSRCMTGDILLLTQTISTGVFNANWDYFYACGMSARDGTLLWGPYNYSKAFMTYFSIGPAANDVWVTYDRQTFEWNGYSLLTGQKMWGPVVPPHNNWDMYGMASHCAYGNLYAVGFGGNIHCIDMQTGTIEWDYATGGGGYDSPFGVWTTWTFSRQSIADGKLYLGQGMEYSPPLYRGAQGMCLDCFTGELVYSVLGYYSISAPAIADGYLVTHNAYDLQLYCFGKGRSATTVTTSPKVIPLGESVLVEGTITDQSPGQTCLGIPAAGTPAIADMYMKHWMEYLYMQQPMPQNATGVPVIVQAMDSDGNMIDIGTVTSDAFGNFKVAFCPDKEDVYTILASFLGTDSYYASYASTGVAVGPEPEEIVIPEPPEPEPAADYTPMFLAIIAAVAVAIIIGLVNLFRKK